VNHNLTIPLVHVRRLPNESDCTPVKETIFTTFSVLCGGMMGYLGGAVTGILAFNRDTDDPYLKKLAFTGTIITALVALTLPYNWHQGCIEQSTIDNDLSAFAAEKPGLNRTTVKCYGISGVCHTINQVAFSSIPIEGELAYRTAHPQLPPSRKKETKPYKSPLQLIPGK